MTARLPFDGLLAIIASNCYGRIQWIASFQVAVNISTKTKRYHLDSLSHTHTHNRLSVLFHISDPLHSAQCNRVEKTCGLCPGRATPPSLYLSFSPTSHPLPLFFSTSSPYSIVSGHFKTNLLKPLFHQARITSKWSTTVTTFSNLLPS